MLDVNALVALAWDSHIHHVPMRAWFARNSSRGWATAYVPRRATSSFDDVSLTDKDLPAIVSHRQVSDAHLLALARRHRARLLTFDTTLMTLSQERDVELLTAF